VVQGNYDEEKRSERKKVSMEIRIGPSPLRELQPEHVKIVQSKFENMQAIEAFIEGDISQRSSLLGGMQDDPDAPVNIILRTSH
jgi:hypothetical protein